MTKTDMKNLLTLSDIAMALGLLTRLPIQVNIATATQRGAAAAWAYPLVGLCIAGFATLAGWGATALGLPIAMAAIFVIGTQIILTGAMHEDGLADCADGFWGGWDISRRLEIMKDSQIGTYGVLALGISVMMRWVAITTLMSLPLNLYGAVLVAIALLSRAAMVGIMGVLKHARASGLSRSVGKPSFATTLTALAIAVVGSVLLLGTLAIGLAVVAVVLALGCGLVARTKIGGQTGDVLGATQQITEVGMLLAAIILLAA